MAIATLTIDVVAKLAELETSMDRAAQIAARNAARMEQAFDTAGKALAALGAGFSVAAMVTGLQRVVDGLDRFNDVSDATGASVEKLSALEQVVQRAGGSFDSAASVLVKFNQVLRDANRGTEGALIFERIGLSVEQLRRADPVDALQQTARALAQFAADGDKARAVQSLFGKSIQEAAPILKDLAEAGQLNATVTAEQAQAAEDFNRAMALLRERGQSAGRALTNEVVPGLTALIKAINDSNAAASTFNAVAGVLSTAFQAITVLGANVAFVFGGVGRELAAIAAQAAALARGDFAAFRAIGEAVREDGVVARQELDALEKKLLGLNQPAAQAAAAAESTARSIGSIGEAAKRSAKELALFRSANEGIAGEFEGRMFMIDAEKKAQQEAERTRQQQVAIDTQINEASRGRLEALRATFSTENELRQAQYDNQIATLQTALLLGQVTEQEFYALREEAKLQHEARMGNIEAQAELQRRQARTQGFRGELQAIAGQFTAISAIGATHSRALFNINKVSAIAQALLGMRETVVDAYKWGTKFGGPPLGAAMAAVATAAQLANIAAIKSAQFGGSTSAPSVSAGQAIPVTPAEIAPASAVQATPAPARSDIRIRVEGLSGDRLLTSQQVRDLIRQIGEEAGFGANVSFVAA